MMLLIHSLEKGMRHPNPRSGFGHEKAESLHARTKEYMEKHGIDQYSQLSLGVLKQYVGHPYAKSSSSLQLFVSETLRKHQALKPELLPGGAKSLDPADILMCYEDAYKFVSTRFSVRDFAQTEISDDHISKAILFAQTTPSACNRQPSRVHIFSSKTTIAMILEHQLGDQGWGSGACRLFVVTSLLSHFDGVYERYQMYIDGGMFAMQFVLALHSLRIASCCKMYIRTPATDKQFRLLTGISRNEAPIMLVLAGNYKEKPGPIPYSYRLSVDEIGKWH